MHTQYFSILLCYGSGIRQADHISKEQKENFWASEVVGFSTPWGFLFIIVAVWPVRM